MVSTELLSKQLSHSFESHGIVVEAMYLYGSHARDEATADSDIDVLVVSPAFTNRGLWSRCALIGNAIADLSEPVQIYPVSPSEFDQPEAGGFLESISQDMKLLYKRPNRRPPTRGKQNGMRSKAARKQQDPRGDSLSHR